jgi:hypothetical protein
MSGLRRLRPLLRLCAVLAVGLLVSACGTSETAQVRTKVQQFATAANHHDYTTICTRVLGARLLADIAAGGVTCQKALALGLGSVKGARLTVGTITITSASRASVLTVSQATGEKTVLSTLELTKEASGWRIEGLGNAATGS